MNPDLNRRWTLLILLSFVPFLVKAVDYAMLGSFVPLVVFSVFGVIVGLGVRAGLKAERLAVKIWASALILWGTVRLGLMGLFKTVDIGEAHPANQVTAWYAVLSLAHLLLGIYLYRGNRRTVQMAGSEHASQDR